MRPPIAFFVPFTCAGSPREDSLIKYKVPVRERRRSVKRAVQSFHIMVSPRTSIEDYLLPYLLNTMKGMIIIDQ